MSAGLRRTTSPSMIVVSTKPNAELADSVENAHSQMSVLDANAQKIEADLDKYAEFESRFLGLPSELYIREGLNFIWKIEQWSQKCRQSAPLESEPFYTSAHGRGYRLQLLLTAADKQWLSVFVRLLPGQYDPILDWPFRDNLSVRLCEQNVVSIAERQDFRALIRPHITEANERYLRRPMGSPNAHFGMEQFARLSQLDEDKFVARDTLTLMVHVLSDAD